MLIDLQQDLWLFVFRRRQDQDNKLGLRQISEGIQVQVALLTVCDKISIDSQQLKWDAIDVRSL